MIGNSATPGEETVRVGVLLKKMPTGHTIANLTSSRGSVMQWFLHLGGLGLIPLGLFDGSLVPILPGSMDIATILLAAHDKKLWFYYPAMATVGSVLGGLPSLQVGSQRREGGARQKAPERECSKDLREV
jgi:hypothetical protein